MKPLRIACLLLFAGCARPPEDVEPPEPTLRKLTEAQYLATLRDLVGPDLVLPAQVPPDLLIDGFAAVGAGLEALSPRSVEQYEAAAFDLAAQAMADEAWRQEYVPCTPQASVDAGCAEDFVRAFGRRAWRRPLTPAEVERLVGVATGAQGTLGDFWAGLSYAMAAQLLSPHLLYRAELGEDDPDRPGKRRFSDWEMASRLSYLLWGTTPDDALLDAAERGDLVTDEGLAAEAARLLADPRARVGVRSFFAEVLKLGDLDDLSKDSTVYVHWSDEVGPDAREETLRTIEQVVFDEDGDYRGLMTRPSSFVNRKLASIYAVQAPSRDGFAETTFPEAQRRRGLLGQVSVLASMAHPVSSSATLRGKFVMERLLCQSIPAPPAGVDTSIPEPTTDAPTLRDRVAVHLSVDECAGCHRLMDPVGLAFEHFDGLGRRREREAGADIDASGELEGDAFDDAWELAQVLHDDPLLTDCLTIQLHRVATGHAQTRGERAEVDRLGLVFGDARYRVLDLLNELILSPAFRDAGVIEPRELRLIDGEGA